jgi:hypothetical protein
MALTWQVPVYECARSEVTQAVDSLRCASGGAKHSGVNFPSFAVLTKALFLFALTFMFLFLFLFFFLLFS